MHRLVNLASLADSLDYLADAIQHFGDSQQPRQSAQVGCHGLISILAVSMYCRHTTSLELLLLGLFIAGSRQQSLDVIRF